MLQSFASSGSDHDRAGSRNSAAKAGARRGYPASASKPCGASPASLDRRRISVNIAVAYYGSVIFDILPRLVSAFLDGERDVTVGLSNLPKDRQVRALRD